MSYARLFLLVVTAILSSSVMFHWTRRPLSCYKDTTTTQSQQTKDNDDEPSSLSHNNQKKYCQWTVAAGDSNNRMAFEEWMGLEQKFQDGRTVRGAKRGPLLYEYAWGGHHCTERWADKEMVVTYPISRNNNSSPDSTTTTPRCHIISSRFMIDQRRSLARLRANLTNSSYCGSELITPPLPDGYERPPKPDMVWYTSGFWGLRPEKRTSCEQRFSHVVDAMLEWKQAGIQRVVWQTGFPVNFHHDFNNTIIQWDYQCQKKLASQHGIEIADLYALVTEGGGPANAVYPGDCHLQRSKLLIPHQYLDHCCGGWEAYLGQK